MHTHKEVFTFSSFFFVWSELFHVFPKIPKSFRNVLNFFLEKTIGHFFPFLRLHMSSSFFFAHRQKDDDLNGHKKRHGR